MLFIGSFSDYKCQLIIQAMTRWSSWNLKIDLKTGLLLVGICEHIHFRCMLTPYKNVTLFTAFIQRSWRTRNWTTYLDNRSPSGDPFGSWWGPVDNLTIFKNLSLLPFGHNSSAVERHHQYHDLETPLVTWAIYICAFGSVLCTRVGLDRLCSQRWHKMLLVHSNCGLASN